jgi:YD repeat-containing protein
VADWVIGFPTKRATTLTATGASAVSRTETFTRHGATSASASAVRLPGTNHTLTTAFSYNARGNVTQVSQSGPNLTTQSSQFSSFMDDRYPLWVTNAEGHASNLDYDRRFGTPRMVADANNRTTWIKRDPFGRVIEIEENDGTITTQTYVACTSTLCNTHKAVLRIDRSTNNGSLRVVPNEQIYLDVLGRDRLDDRRTAVDRPRKVRVEVDDEDPGRMCDRPHRSRRIAIDRQQDDRAVVDVELDPADRLVVRRQVHVRFEVEHAREPARGSGGALVMDAHRDARDVLRLFRRVVAARDPVADPRQRAHPRGAAGIASALW